MIEKEIIKEKLISIKQRRTTWEMSNRRKNTITLTKLGINIDVMLTEICEGLRWDDYVSGPELDNHASPIPGDVWVFGMTISEIDCYLKFQDKPSGVVLWISIHEAEKPLHFPFK